MKHSWEPLTNTSHVTPRSQVKSNKIPSELFSIVNFPESLKHFDSQNNINQTNRFEQTSIFDNMNYSGHTLGV